VIANEEDLMPATLLLRLAGPMQAWGTESRFDVRDTRREPTKSGVIGLLCAALGKPRQETPDDGHPPLAALAALRMGVRVDREGTLAVDFHTAGGVHRRGDRYGVRRASGKEGTTVVSRRYYLADAAFLVGLEGDKALLVHLGTALASPTWQLSLGRKAFVPGVPVHVACGRPEDGGMVDLPLEQALTRVEWPPHGSSELRAVVDVPHGRHSDTRNDVPVDFAARQFGVRYVDTRFIRREEG
jgi:CRISPR system Cascade subunit CasD